MLGSRAIEDYAKIYVIYDLGDDDFINFPKSLVFAKYSMYIVSPRADLKVINS